MNQPKQIPDQKQEFLNALDAYVLSMIEQSAARGTSVSTTTIERWRNARSNLALTLDNLLDGVRS